MTGGGIGDFFLKKSIEEYQGKQEVNMSKTGKRTAHTFRKQFNVLKPTLEKLKEIIVSQGYTIVEFNPVFNDDDVATVIEELKLKNFIGK